MQPVQSVVRIAEIRDGAFSRGKLESVAKFKSRLLNMESDEADRICEMSAAMERGTTFPPIFLARIDGKLELLDGFHRLSAAALRGRGTVRAVIFNVESDKAADALAKLFFEFEFTGAPWQHRARAGAALLAA